jgi:hypothetical protein
MSPLRERGGATLVATLILFFVMTLAAAFASRQQVFEQKASANQYRRTQAFEAAEAGLEWALAMLNLPQPVDDGCRPAAAPGASFRERHLATDPGGALRPLTWNDRGTATPLRASCVRGASGWDCACPRDGAPLIGTGADTSSAPAFVVEFTALPHSGTVRLLATGCTRLAGPCLPASSVAADAVAHAEVGLALVPGLSAPPAAALTVRGDVDAGSAALGLHNADAASGGIAVQAGGRLVAPGARITTAAGGSVAAAQLEGDETLAATPPDRLFASLFGLSKSLWRQHPGVTSIDCGGPCDAALASAAGPLAGARLLWIDGDADLDGPLVLGSRERPVLLVCSGALRLRGGVAIHGMVYAAHLSWAPGSGAGVLHGAAVSESGYTGSAAADFVYDPGVLSALKTGTGSFVRVPGSWRDF